LTNKTVILVDDGSRDGSPENRRSER
jgi:glycosyltransferase involved in cell wall biosynthesis